ncbi:MAG: signal recognition particle-docking protein FtsY [Proteobacteria bacterium]|nr:signal recognition particle-docking protein FtsY [Pseudomonadota bacterium]
MPCQDRYSQHVFNFLKKNEESNAPAKQGWLSRLNAGLKKTRKVFTDSLANLILGKKQIDAQLLRDLETQLLLADVGVEVTEHILKQLTEQVARNELNDPQKLIESLKKQLTRQLIPYEQPLQPTEQPFVILMVGINGSGKTTSAAKICHFYQQQGKRVMLAAGDTFRAAAIEQLQIWGERNQVPVIAQHQGADSASVIYDAMQAAQAKKFDLLIADTAGRLHTQEPLMAELAKIKRVMSKLDPKAPHEVLLVIDAGIGQNALRQAEQFHQSLGLTGLCLTKLDGTAKGGMLFSISNKMKLPIRFIGIGEQVDDLKPFQANEFIEALFGQ